MIESGSEHCQANANGSTSSPFKEKSFSRGYTRMSADQSGKPTLARQRTHAF
jgi:hypothetical protein